MNRDELRNHHKVVFMTPSGTDRAVDEVMRLREALCRAGETHPDARRIADEALAQVPRADTFQTQVK